MTKRSSELERAVSNLLRLKGYSFMRVSNYRCFRCHQVMNAPAKGFPDYFIYCPGLFAVECKTGKGRLTKEQKEVKRKLEKVGIDYIVVRDNIDELLKYLEGK